MPPAQGGVSDLICDMNECYCPLGRAHFTRSPLQCRDQIQDWIPSEDHYPRARAVGGAKLPGMSGLHTDGATVTTSVSVGATRSE